MGLLFWCVFFSNYYCFLSTSTVDVVRLFFAKSKLLLIDLLLHSARRALLLVIAYLLAVYASDTTSVTLVSVLPHDDSCANYIANLVASNDIGQIHLDLGILS